MSKRCEDIISKPIKWEIFSILLLFFLCWCDASSSCIIWWHIFCHGWQKSPKKQVLQFTCWALCNDCTMHRHCSAYMYFFPEMCGGFLVCFFTRFTTRGACFWLLLWHGDLKWFKTEVVSPGSDAQQRELNWMQWLVSWFKTQMPIGHGTTTDMKKAHEILSSLPCLTLQSAQNTVIHSLHLPVL